MSRKSRVSTKVTQKFADNLGDLVAEKKATGLSQKEIAAGIGVSSGSLSEWCSDYVTATIDNLDQVASYFNVSTDSLLGRTPAQSIQESELIVQNLTGLSKRAANHLVIFNEGRESDALTPYVIGNNLLAFWSDFISDESITVGIMMELHKIIMIKDSGLSDVEKEVFRDSEEAIAFYKHKLNQAISEYIDKFIEKALNSD